MKLIKLIAFTGIFLSFISCNTVIGVGRDIKQVGTTLSGGVKKGGDALGSGIENKGYGKPWNEQTNSQSNTPPQP